jgi:hypothetical protein
MMPPYGLDDRLHEESFVWVYNLTSVKKSHAVVCGGRGFVLAGTQRESFSVRCSWSDVVVVPFWEFRSKSESSLKKIIL